MSDAGDPGEGDEGKEESESSRGAVPGMAVLKVNEDVYGDMLMSMLMVDQLSGIDDGQKTHKYKPLWILTSLFLYVLNIALQVLTSFAVFSQSIEMTEDAYEVGLPEKVAKLQNSITTGSRLASNDGALVLCERNKVEFVPIYFLILFLWYSRMIQEWAEGLWLFLVIKGMPSTRDGKDMIDDEDSEARSLQRVSSSDVDDGIQKMIIVDGPAEDPFYRVVCLTPFMKCMLLCVIAVPKFIIALWIAWMGGKFLMMAQDSASLILKALACSYFVTIDELLFKSFVSEGKKDMVRKAVLNLWQEVNEGWVNWGSSVTRTLVVVAAVLVNYFVFQNIYTFRITCQEYKSAFPDPNAPSNRGLTWLLF